MCCGGLHTVSWFVGGGKSVHSAVGQCMWAELSRLAVLRMHWLGSGTLLETNNARGVFVYNIWRIRRIGTHAKKGNLANQPMIAKRRPKWVQLSKRSKIRLLLSTPEMDLKFPCASNGHNMTQALCRVWAKVPTGSKHNLSLWANIPTCPKWMQCGSCSG